MKLQSQQSQRLLRRIAAVLLLAGATGCQTGVDSESNPAASYLFPKSKLTSQPGYSLTKAEKQVALRELRRRRGELLYEVIVDRAGTVQKIRVVKALEGNDRDFFTIGFMQRIKTYQFSASTNPVPYRTFFYPLNVQSTMEFPGSDVFLD